MDRREFTKVMGVVAAGMLAGSKAFADEKAAPAKKAAAKATEKHVCKGMNNCKGEGAGGKNACKGKGGCATVAKHECATKNDCKGMGGCAKGDNGCAGKNSCKGKGGCAVPMSEAHMKALKDKDKAGKSSCKGKSGCKGR
jgi:hypothetical protein